ncbi:MAG: PilZ domain-containing protein [Deltaproteobacteria bacterium]|nr:PilZ domain-containing protein [Deltaproteobacteria bacterium]
MAFWPGIGIIAPMTHPAQQARSHIMTALETCQDEPALENQLRELTHLLAKAQRRLFTAGQLPVDSPGCIDMTKRAMETLAQSLQILQDLDVGATTSGRAAKSIASALQLLHPLVHAAPENKARVSRRPVAPSITEAVNVDTMLSTGSSHQIYNGFSQDIQEGGIFIATFEPREKGSEILVNFKLPQNKTVSTCGVVQFVREYNPSHPDTPPGMGVKFKNLSHSSQQAIEQFLKNRTAMFYDE